MAFHLGNGARPHHRSPQRAMNRGRGRGGRGGPGRGGLAGFSGSALGHAEAIKETQWRNILDSLQQMELQLLRQQLDVQGMDDILAHGPAIFAALFRSSRLRSSVHVAGKIIAYLAQCCPLVMQCRDEAGSTPLHACVRLNVPFTLAECLIRNGADVEARDALGRTPIVEALLSNSALNWLTSLVSVGARMDVVCGEGRTVLHYACQRCFNPETELLIDQVLSLSPSSAWSRDNQGLLPLIYAMQGPRPLPDLTLPFPDSATCHRIILRLEALLQGRPWERVGADRSAPRPPWHDLPPSAVTRLMRLIVATPPQAMAEPDIVKLTPFHYAVMGMERNEHMLMALLMHVGTRVSLPSNLISTCLIWGNLKAAIYLNRKGIGPDLPSPEGVAMVNDTIMRLRWEAQHAGHASVPGPFPVAAPPPPPPPPPRPDAGSLPPVPLGGMPGGGIGKARWESRAGKRRAHAASARSGEPSSSQLSASSSSLSMSTSEPAPKKAKAVDDSRASLISVTVSVPPQAQAKSAPPAHADASASKPASHGSSRPSPGGGSSQSVGREGAETDHQRSKRGQREAPPPPPTPPSSPTAAVEGSAASRAPAAASTSLSAPHAAAPAMPRDAPESDMMEVEQQAGTEPTREEKASASTPAPDQLREERREVGDLQAPQPLTLQAPQPSTLHAPQQQQPGVALNPPPAPAEAPAPLPATPCPSQEPPAAAQEQQPPSAQEQGPPSPQREPVRVTLSARGRPAPLGAFQAGLLEEEFRALQAENARLKEMLEMQGGGGDARSEVQRLKAQLRQAEEERVKVQHMLDEQNKVKEKHERMREEHNRLQASMARAQEHEDEARATAATELANVMRECMAAKAEAVKAKADCQTTRAEARAARDKEKDAQADVTKLRDELRGVRKRCEEAEGARVELEAKLKAAVTSEMQVKGKLVQLTTEKDRLHAELKAEAQKRAVKEVSERALKAEQSGREAALKAVNEEAERTRQSLEQRVKAMEAEDKEKERRLQALQCQLYDQQQQIRGIENSNWPLPPAAAQLGFACISDLVTEITATRGTLQRLAEAQSGLLTAVEARSLEDVQQELLKARSDLATRTSLLDEMNKSLSSMTSSSEELLAERNALKDKASALEAQVKEAKSKADNLGTANGELRAKVAKLEAAVKQAQKDAGDERAARRRVEDDCARRHGGGRGSSTGHGQGQSESGGSPSSSSADPWRSGTQERRRDLAQLESKLKDERRRNERLQDDVDRLKRQLQRGERGGRDRSRSRERERFGGGSGGDGRGSERRGDDSRAALEEAQGKVRQLEEQAAASNGRLRETEKVLQSEREAYRELQHANLELRTDWSDLDEWVTGLQGEVGVGSRHELQAFLRRGLEALRREEEEKQRAQEGSRVLLPTARGSKAPGQPRTDVRATPMSPQTETITDASQRIAELEEELADREAYEQSITTEHFKYKTEVNEAKAFLMELDSYRPGLVPSRTFCEAADDEVEQALREFETASGSSGGKVKRQSKVALLKAIQAVDGHLRDSKFDPFVRSQGVIIAEDWEGNKELKAIVKKWGEPLARLVVEKKREIEEHNPSGSYPVKKLWMDGKEPSLVVALRHMANKLKLLITGTTSSSSSSSSRTSTSEPDTPPIVLRARSV